MEDRRRARRLEGALYDDELGVFLLDFGQAIFTTQATIVDEVPAATTVTRRDIWPHEPFIPD